MYCSSCGRSLPENLNYCNNCGARNEKNALVAGNSSARPFAVAAMVIGGGGLFGFLLVMRMLLRSSLDQPAVLLLLLAYLLTVFLMFVVLIGYVWKNSGDIRIKAKKGGEDSNTRQSFHGINTAQLDEPRQPVASVTDHTTRTLDKVPLERI